MEKGLEFRDVVLMLAGRNRLGKRLLERLRRWIHMMFSKEYSKLTIHEVSNIWNV